MENTFDLPDENLDLTDNEEELPEENLDSFEINLLRFNNVQEYRTELEKLYSRGEITKDSYYSELISIENFKLEYSKQDLEIVLTEEGLELMEEINKTRKELKENINNMTIGDYNNKYLDTITKEKEIYKDYSISSNVKKINKLDDMTLIEKLEEFEKRENSLIRQLAKEHNIFLPKLKPEDKNSVEEYNRIADKIKTNYLPGYKIGRINISNINNPEWVIEPPLLNSLKEIKVLDKPRELVSEPEILNTQDLPLETKEIPYILQQQERRTAVYNKLTRLSQITTDPRLKGKIVRDPISISPIKESEITVNENNEIMFKDYKLTPNKPFGFIPIIYAENNLNLKAEDITFIYILIKNKTRNVYIDFKEYLQELKNTLEVNIIETTDKSSIQVLKDRISQIDYYLETNEYLTIDRISNKPEIKEIREQGLRILTELFSEYKANVINNASNLEEDIFKSSIDYSEVDTSRYFYIIDKIKFVSIQYNDILVDYLAGKIENFKLINFEVPSTFPDDFTFKESFGKLTPSQKLSKILEWSPPDKYYRKYKSFIPKNKNITQLTDNLEKQGIKLSSLELNKILQEDYERTRWEEIKATTVFKETPPNTNEFLWKFKLLNDKRNTLPSMRIYQVAEIPERLENIKVLSMVIKKCLMNTDEKLGYIIEKVIFEKARTNKEYKFLISNALTNYKVLCKKNQNATDLETILRVVSYFVLGNIDPETISKISSAIENKNENLLLELITPDESEILMKIATETSSNENTSLLPLKFIGNLYAKTLAKSRINSYTKAKNAYQVPYVSNTRPDAGVKYHFVNGKYIHQTNLPGYRNSNGTINYTRKQIIELANIYDIIPNEELEDYDLYKQTVGFINDLSNKSIIVNTNNTKIQYLPDKVEPKGTKKMFYFRREPGYPPPGRPYHAFKDPQQRSYGVPFEYTQGSIPVYSMELKELAENKFITIEPPGVFKKTDAPSSNVTTEYFIEVEYKNHANKIVYFKEGVPKDKLKYSSSPKIETCSFYKTKEDCNGPFSYSLSGEKCEWENNRCKAKEKTLQKDTSVFFWETTDPNIKERWEHGLKLIRIYLKDRIENENLNLKQIRNLLSEYAVELEDFRNRLTNESLMSNVENPIGEPEINENLNNFDLKEFKESINEILPAVKPKQKETKNTSDLLSNYKELFVPVYQSEITVYTPENLSKLKTIRLDLFGSEENFTVVEANNESVKLKKTNRTFKVKLDNLNKAVKPLLTKSTKIAYISKENEILLNNPPAGFYFYHSKPNYKFTENETIDYSIKTNKVKYIPLQKITPTGKTPDGDHLEITKADINLAIEKLAFTTQTEKDEYLSLTKSLDITQEAIRFCLTQNIDPENINKETQIELQDVIEFYETGPLKPKIISLEEKLKAKVEKAVKYQNEKLLQSVIKEIEKLKDENLIELLELATNSLITLTENKEQQTKLNEMIAQKTSEFKKEIESSIAQKEAQIIKNHKKAVSGQNARKTRNL